MRRRGPDHGPSRHMGQEEKLGLEKNSPKQARGSDCLRRRRKELARQGVSKDRRSEGKRMRLKIRK